MSKFKAQNKSKCQNSKHKINPNVKCQILKQKVLSFGICALCSFWILCFGICHSTFAQEQFTYDAKGKRNPFIPLVTADGRLLKLEQETITGIILEGIIYDKNGLSYAIVNGEVVKIGDKIGDYQVLKIEENKVTFVKEGQPIEMELKKEE